MGILLVYDVTDERSFNSTPLTYSVFILLEPIIGADIRTWHANIEQHASEGVNKILIGNKCDWTDKRAVSEDQGRELSEELGVKFIETSAKINEGVEDAFFTLARCVPSFPSPFISIYSILCNVCSDIKARLIDSQADAAGAPSNTAPDSVRVNQPAAITGQGCCT